jgi:hypothetical protein
MFRPEEEEEEEEIGKSAIGLKVAGGGLRIGSCYYFFKLKFLSFNEPS